MKGVHLAGDSYLFLKKQFFITLAGWLFLFKAHAIPEKIWKRIPLISYFLVLFMLLGIFIPGLYPEISGAKRWMRLGFLQFQPGEFAKLALILILAKNLARPGHRSHNLLKGILPNLGFFFIYALLLMLQPDFGTTVLLALVCFFLLCLAGIPKKTIAGMVLSGIAIIASLVAIAPYRMKRLIVFLDPWQQVHDGGFQIIQSYLSFQNGSLLGNGLGESKQKLFFLPEAHTDFILAVIGEELGFIGVTFLILCYFSLIFAAFRVTQKQQDSFWYYSCLGITLTLSFQTLINMGVVMGLLPTKGIPLPLISNGASSLVAYILMIGLLLVANKRYPLKQVASTGTSIK